MITTKQLEDLEGCAKLLLQKVTFAKGAVRVLESLEKNGTASPFAIKTAEQDVARQQRNLFAVADELRDEIAKLPNPAVTTGRQD
jgi:hypothetical protein